MRHSLLLELASRSPRTPFDRERTSMTLNTIRISLLAFPSTRIHTNCRFDPEWEQVSFFCGEREIVREATGLSGLRTSGRRAVVSFARLSV